MFPSAPERARQSYRHEAWLWRGRDELVAGLVPFVRDGVGAGEPVMVALVPEHASWLRNALGADAAQVHFVDMAVLGHNPARIIPAWLEFLSRHSGYRRPLRGVGEPIWPGRRPEEVLECQLHEALLNLAVDPKVPFWLVCPYDQQHLGQSIIAEAHRSHPAIATADSYQGSPHYGGQTHADALFTAELPPVPAQAAKLKVQDPDAAFEFVALHAAAAGVWSNTVVDLAAVARRLVTASLQRGAAQADVTIWDRGDALIYEVADPSVIDDHLVGRRAPDATTDDPVSWANRVCDLVQTRSSTWGTRIRLHTWK